MAVPGQGGSVHRLDPVFSCDQNFNGGSGSLPRDANVPEGMAAYHQSVWYKGHRQCLSQCRDHCHSCYLYVSGILMTSSLSGVRANPRLRSTVLSCEILVDTWWIGRVSFRRLIAHRIHVGSTDRLFFRHSIGTLRLVICSSVIQGSHQGLIVLLKEGD